MTSTTPSLTFDPPSGTVLLVEDEQILRMLVTEMLERQGFDVVAAPDPIEALELAASRTFDLLLTDVVMPKMSGRELGACLRERQPDLPIVFMSGYTADAVNERGGLDPGDHFLQKPFTEDELAQKVCGALDSSAPLVV